MANVFNIAKKQMVDGALDLDAAGDDIRCLLLRSDGGGPYVFDPDAANITALLAPATSVEVSVASYARQALTGEATTQNDTNDRAEAAANKATFAGLETGQTVGTAIIFKFVTNDGDSPPLAHFDVTDTPTNGGDIEIRWDGVDGVGDYLRVT